MQKALKKNRGCYNLKIHYTPLHAEHHYIFYRISQNHLLISDIYNERENFMQKLFGISLRALESIDYWGELLNPSTTSSA